MGFASMREDIQTRLDDVQHVLDRLAAQPVQVSVEELEKVRSRATAQIRHIRDELLGMLDNITDPNLDIASQSLKLQKENKSLREQISIVREKVSKWERSREGLLNERTALRNRCEVLTAECEALRGQLQREPKAQGTVTRRSRNR